MLTEVKWVFSKSILRVLPLNAARHRTSNVSRSVVGLRHFTRNASIRSQLLKLWIRDKVLCMESFHSVLQV